MKIQYIKISGMQLIQCLWGNVNLIEKRKVRLNDLSFHLIKLEQEKESKPIIHKRKK